MTPKDEEGRAPEQGTDTRARTPRHGRAGRRGGRRPAGGPRAGLGEGRFGIARGLWPAGERGVPARVTSGERPSLRSSQRLAGLPSALPARWPGGGEAAGAGEESPRRSPYLPCLAATPRRRAGRRVRGAGLLRGRGGGGARARGWPRRPLPHLREARSPPAPAPAPRLARSGLRRVRGGARWKGGAAEPRGRLLGSGRGIVTRRRRAPIFRLRPELPVFSGNARIQKRLQRKRGQRFWM